MKKNFYRFIFFFFLGISSATSLAQPSEKGFSAFISLGINPSQIDGDRIWGFNLIRLNGGMGVRYTFNESWALSLESIYSGRGARSTQNQDYLRVKMDYIDVPLLAQYNLKLSKKHYNLVFGLTPAYHIQSYIDDFGIGYRELTPYLTTWDIGTTGGIIFYLESRWAFSARYTYSALPINNKKTSPISPILVYGDWYNNYLSFSIQYVIK